MSVLIICMALIVMSWASVQDLVQRVPHGYRNVFVEMISTMEMEKKPKSKGKSSSSSNKSNKRSKGKSKGKSKQDKDNGKLKPETEPESEELSEECHLILYTLLSDCAFGDPRGFEEERRCDRIVNTFLLKCIDLTPVPGEPGTASFKGKKV